MPEERPRIFLSHYAGEAHVAEALQGVLEATFAVTSFRSSDQQSIALGKSFDQEILSALQHTSIGLYLLSPISVNRPWIHFEIGALWALDKPMIPICFGGLTFEALPGPIFGKNGLNAGDANGRIRLLRAIEDTLGIRTRRSPDWRAFNRELAKYDSQVKKASIIQVARDIALLSTTYDPNLHDIVRVILGGGGGIEISLFDRQKAESDALSRLVDNQYLEVRPRELLDKGRRLVLSSNPKYDSVYLEAEFKTALSESLGV